MSNVSTKKVFIQIESEAEQQEHIKNQRKTLKVIQGVATDKENLIGRPQIDKLHRLKANSEALLASTECPKRKKIEIRSIETQTSPRKYEKQIIEEDLTSTSEPSEFYWKKLAEKRRGALEETLIENQHLHERIDGLEAELNTSRKMLEEAQSLVEILTDMLKENEAGNEEHTETGITPIPDEADDEEDTKSSEGEPKN